MRTEKRGRRRYFGASCGAACIVVMSTLAGAADTQTKGDLSELIEAVSDGYAGTVATERYSQIQTRLIVETVGEFTSLRDDGRWIGVRRIETVNGRKVTDSNDRLLEIIRDGIDGLAIEHLSTETARFNRGEVIRTINNPVAMLAFFDPMAGLTFGETSVVKVGREQLYETTFVERRRPTLVRTKGGIDVPATGKTWVTETGALAKLEIELPLVAADGQQTGRKALLSLGFAYDSGIDAVVPVDLHERYLTASGFAFFEARAVYSDYRRYGVSVSEGKREESGEVKP